MNELPEGIYAVLKPLQGKYYGTFVDVYTKEKEHLGAAKFWLATVNYTLEDISPREAEENAISEDQLHDWDWTHSENMLTYQLAITFVNAINNETDNLQRTEGKQA